MDSVLGEDPSLPIDFNGSANILELPDVADNSQSLISASNEILSFADHGFSPIRARTMKDFENQITDLKKENFNLKLRIYFLEEQVKEKFDGASENVYKTNIELKVEVESLKHHLQEKHNLLIKASKAVESLTGDSGSTVQRMREDAQKQVQIVEEFLNSKIIQLEEELKAAQTSLQTVSALLEDEKVLRKRSEQKLSQMPSTHEEIVIATARMTEKDRVIEQPNLALKGKGGSIKEEAHARPCDERYMDDKIKELTECLHKKDGEIESLKMELKTKAEELNIEKKNGLKRDKTIQGLTLALKTKEKENDDFSQEIDDLNALLARARDATHKVQIQKFKGVEDYQTILMEKETLIGELHGDFHTKEMENRKLQGIIKRKDHELHAVYQEKGQLEKELDECQQLKSRDDKTINDLRNQLEKLHGEITEKENAVEQHYIILLSESSQKLKNHEQTIKQLTEDLNKKNQSLKKPLDDILNKEKEEQMNQLLVNVKKTKQELEHLSNLLAIKETNIKEQDRVIKEKDAELVQLFNELQNLMKVNEELERNSACSLKEKDGVISTLQESLANRNHDAEEQDRVIKEKDAELVQLFNELKNLVKVNEELERNSACSLKEKDGVISTLQESLANRNHDAELKKQTEYEDLIYTYKWEHHSVFTESEKKPERSLKTELDTICLLRKQLEDDIQANQELRKILEEKMKMGKSRDDDTYSFCWDQTTYLSICLGEKDPLNLDIENLSLVELRQKVRELLLLVQELQSRNQEGNNKQCNHCLRNVEDDENDNTLSQDMFLPSAYLNVGVDEGLQSEQTEAQPSLDSAEKSLEKQEMDLFEDDLLPAVCLSKHSGNLFESRNLSFSKCILEQERSSDQLSEASDRSASCKENINEDLKTICCDVCKENINEDLKDLIVQLRNELNHVKNENETLKQEIGLQTSFIETKRFSPDIQFVPTSAVTTFGQDEDYSHLVGKDGQRVLEEPTSNVVHDKIEDKVPATSNVTDPTYVTHKSHKKSRLPVPLKPYRSSTSQKMAITSRKMVIDKLLEANGEQTLEKQKMQHEDRKNVSETLIEHVKEESEMKNVLIDGCEVNNDNPQVFMENQNSQICLTSNGGTSSSDLNSSFSSLTPFIKQDILDEFESQNSKSPLQKSTTDVQLPLQNDQRSCFQTLASSDEKETKCVAENHFQYAYELQKEKAENVKLLDQVSSLQRKVEERSPSRYDSLVQSQARELSFQRQQIRDGHNMAMVYHDHLVNLIKAFEELLQASDVDYYVAEGFREQLNQSMQLLQTLEEKLCYGDDVSDPEGSVIYDLENGYQQGIGNSILTTYHLNQQLESEVPVPSICHDMSDNESIEKSPAQSLELIQDALEREHERNILSSQGLSQDLLMEHLQEIRILRHRLEDSIKTNDRLRHQLERQIAEAELDHGSTNVYSDNSQHTTLISEISFLRRQNESLKDLLARGSRDKQMENEKLRESLSKKNFMMDHLQSEYESIRKENETLQNNLKDKDEEIQCLTQEICGSRNEINRLQSELNTQQNRLSDDKHVLQSLRIELAVYEKMREANQIETDVRQESLEEFAKEQVKSLDLSKLLSEIQCLRVQLERSIEANNALRKKLEEQISKGNDEPEKKESQLKMNNDFKEECQHGVEKHDVNIDAEFSKSESGIKTLKTNEFGKLSKGNSSEVENSHNAQFQSCKDLLKNEHSSAQSNSNSLVSLPTGSSNVAPASRLWADKNGCYILGLNEDYCVLRKQMSDGRKILRKTEAHLKDIQSILLGSSGSKLQDQDPLTSIIANINKAQQVLEEANHSSKLLWRVSLPMKVTGNTSNRDEQMKMEIIRLRKTLAEHEKKLHSTMKRLHATNRIKEDMEKIIIDQLALTHGVLKKARGNLENPLVEIQPGT
ncbi:CDK5 regulatory subunit-associated protein 2 isoform X2 [Ambystoma mexicanum]|uniref:CDK5 regulatory subunit-associated protein 2 isoform X2 n=1 Tax=Ambystoma mexicanum TaxID=8296 RepID=UPI0037E79CEF